MSTPLIDTVSFVLGLAKPGVAQPHSLDNQ
jgi:hypothetical protein